MSHTSASMEPGSCPSQPWGNPGPGVRGGRAFSEQTKTNEPASADTTHDRNANCTTDKAPSGEEVTMRGYTAKKGNRYYAVI